MHLYQFSLRGFGSAELSASSPDVALAALRLRQGAWFLYEALTYPQVGSSCATQDPGIQNFGVRRKRRTLFFERIPSADLLILSGATALRVALD